MSRRKSLAQLLVVLTTIPLLSTTLGVYILYRAALIEEEERLAAMANGQAVLVEAFARTTRDPDLTLATIEKAIEKFQDSERSGELVLARREGDHIVFLFSHRRGVHTGLNPIPLVRSWAEPMRRALSGQTGTMTGLDYLGVRVLAAYAPIQGLNWGIVAKIDLVQVQAPYLRAGEMAAGIALLLVLIGGFLFLAKTQPLMGELAESEQRYRRIVETAQEGIWLVSAEGKTAYVNQQMAAMLGFTVEEMMNRSASDLWEEAVRGGAEASWKPPNLSVPERFDCGLRRKDGSVLWAAVSTNPFSSAKGKFLGVLVMITDITERKRVEEALRESEATYRSLVEGVSYGIYRSTAEGKLLAANPALVAMLGYGSETELLAMNLATDVYRDPTERARLIEEHRNRERFEGVVAEWKRKDGKPITVRLSGRLMRDARGVVIGFEGIVENVTDRHLLEEEFRQAQKMEAVGRLAGGVAHDFSNLLLGIGGYAELLLRSMGEDDPLRKYPEEIYRAAERANMLTRRLLAFSRKQVHEPNILNLNVLVTELSIMVRQLIGEDIELITVLGPALGQVKADRSQIEQVIMNLAVNARDAMPQGGKLTLETANVELPSAPGSEPNSERRSGSVMMVVSDTGVGMDEETRARMFEPFFTTKEQGQGTGLGLATVYGIVQQSGGQISVESAPGQGTTIRIYLPRVQEGTEALQRAKVAATGLRGSETILLVEDDEPTRKVTRELLESIGYTVLEAGSGAEAIGQWLRHEGPIHLLLSDIVMPGMSGIELTEGLLPLHPEMRVLFMSGYLGDIAGGPALLATDTAFLQKPFTLETLALKVREVLDRTKPESVH